MSERVTFVTRIRISRFCRDILEEAGTDIGFVDVGSGGDLKEPWNHLPKFRLKTIDFEPTRTKNGEVPLCISNRTGIAPFFVARDERASSFHKPSQDFVRRFGLDDMLPERETTVSCITLDEYMSGRYETADALDINVEGHDFQVLQGATALLAAGSPKLIKVEFELAPAWEGQGWFSDIDVFLRLRNFRLAHIQIDCVRPASVSHLFHRGEPIWGKALYAPNREQFGARLSRIHDMEPGAARKELARAIALYVAAQLPGLAYDAIEQAEAVGVMAMNEGKQLRARIDEAFRWARLEAGLSQLGRLGSAVFTRFIGKRR